MINASPAGDEPAHGTFDGAGLSAFRLWSQSLFYARGGDCVSVLESGLFDHGAADDCSCARAWLALSASGAPTALQILFQALAEHSALGTLQ